MGYKMSVDMKGMFLGNVALIVVGAVSGSEPIVLTSIIIFVILSVSVQILEAIHETRG